MIFRDTVNVVMGIACLRFKGRNQQASVAIRQCCPRAASSRSEGHNARQNRSGHCNLHGPCISNCTDAVNLRYKEMQLYVVVDGRSRHEMLKVCTWLPTTVVNRPVTVFRLTYTT